MADPVWITSRENPLVKELKRLAQDNAAYRKSGRFWVEGEHLCSAALARGVQPQMLVVSQNAWPAMEKAILEPAAQVVVLSDALFANVSGLESPARFGYLMALPTSRDIQAGRNTVVLDRLQDAGNVGSILRSAAAFGFGQVIALKGCAALWSPKVLRAGMGAHFGLHLIELQEPESLGQLQLPLVVTSSHQGEFIQSMQLPSPCAWILGHEGQGVRAELMERADCRVRIGQPGGEESLNVAAAAAICLHASSLGRSQAV